MGRVNASLDEDLYDRICEDHGRTGTSKSQIENDLVREGYEARDQEPTLDDSVLPVFGQSLFVAGFVIAAYSPFAVGVGTALIGLALLIGAKVDRHMAEYDLDAPTALVRVLGA
jgi:hypothetical protein